MLQVCAVVESCGSLSPLRLAQREDISVTLAREQLLTAERLGRLCRDNTVGGLVFYPNRFLSEAGWKGKSGCFFFFENINKALWSYEVKSEWNRDGSLHAT